MAIRFTDDLTGNIDENDFIVRKRLPLIMQIILIFTGAFVAILITAILMTSSGGKLLFFLTLTFCIGILLTFTAYYTTRLHDLIMATEYQNAMLASAAQLATRFCLIAKRDGSIVYIDPGFQTLFPAFMQSSARTIDALMTSSGIPQNIIDQTSAILGQNKNDRVMLSLNEPGGGPIKIMMSIDPLPRPKGYVLMRGRDFIEKRSAEAPAEKKDTTAGEAKKDDDARK